MTTQNTLFVNQITENTPVDKIITYMLGVQDPGSAQEWRTSSDLRRSVYLKSMPHVCFIILIFSRGPEKRTHIIGAYTYICDFLTSIHNSSWNFAEPPPYQSKDGEGSALLTEISRSGAVCHQVSRTCLNEVRIRAPKDKQNCLQWWCLMNLRDSAISCIHLDDETCFISGFFDDFPSEVV